MTEKQQNTNPQAEVFRCVTLKKPSTNWDSSPYWEIFCNLVYAVPNQGRTEHFLPAEVYEDKKYGKISSRTKKWVLRCFRVLEKDPQLKMTPDGVGWMHEDRLEKIIGPLGSKY